MKKRLFLLLLLLCLLIDLQSYRANYTHFYIEVMARTNPYFIHVDLDDNIMYIFKDGEVAATYPVSGGKYSTPSPLGTWTIISKAKWNEGFGGTWMGFNVPWGKYGIHGTDEPWSIGKDLSLGCIRMYNDDAAKVREMIPVGTRITIVKGPYGSFGNGFRVLKPGNIGSDVLAVERKLQSMGFYKGWPNGIYDESLKNAIHKFQKENNLPISNEITKDDYEKMGFIPFE